MDTHLKEELKEYIFQAVQSTKKENSGLVGDIKTNIAVLQTHYNEIKEILEAIKIQTTKTNGSVTSLNLSRSWMIGIGSGIMILVFPLITYIFNDRINQTNTAIEKIREDVASQVVSQLEAKYYIQIK